MIIANIIHYFNFRKEKINTYLDLVEHKNDIFRSIFFFEKFSIKTFPDIMFKTGMLNEQNSWKNYENLDFIASV